ncbi:TetR/AcrR family transcriptional regulator [Planctomonas psychrotolerans]|uniref:TetR/AcrR family transcriptional regulator n=1 Tax=Planctomonas psychrotolerans TaxID=2528712 RepID=UPI0012395FFF|nr:TetR/AcrR family transcriptional regulator [Planctomonas psychrotolerans]
MPRAGLTPDVVTREAAALVDEVGLESLTFAALASRVGVAVPSLYKHVPSIAALHRRLSALATEELGNALAAATEGRAGEDALRSVAAAYRSYALERPRLYPATQRVPLPDDAPHVAHADRVVGSVFAILRGYGIDGDDAVDAARVVRSSLHGFVDIERSGGFGLPRDIDASFARLVDSLHAALDGWTGGR